MASYQRTIANYQDRYANILHDQLPSLLNGTGEDYTVESLGPDFSIKVGTDLVSVSQNDLEAVLDTHMGLSLSSDQAQITANGSDTAVISCEDAVISGDSQVDYEVYDVNGGREFWGSVNVVSGRAEWNFSTAVAGSYFVRFARQGSGNYEDGCIEVEAI